MKKKLLIFGLILFLPFLGAGRIVNQAIAAGADSGNKTGNDILIIVVKQVSGGISSSPEARVWAGVSKTVVSLLPQDVAVPKEFSPSISEIAVQAVINQKEIAIRLEWADTSNNNSALRHDDYRDAAAVMFPVDPTGEKPPDEVQEILPFMGDEGHAVNIWHWKGDWQREYSIDNPLKNEQYPNMQVDAQDRITASGKKEDLFDTGEQLKNILADESLRNTSVEDLNAIGFGTLTTQPSQDVNGNGIYGNNSWKVVMKRNIVNDDMGDIQFARFGTYVPIAFAVWDGQHGEIGGMKGRTAWHYLKMK